MTPKQHLKLKHKHMISIAIYKGDRSEDVPIQEDWIDFESFYRLNKGRYYRARKKWKDKLNSLS